MSDRPAAALVDVASIGVLVGTSANVLPPLAALFTIAWCALQIWESRTANRVREWLASKRSS